MISPLPGLFPPPREEDQGAATCPRKRAEFFPHAPGMVQLCGQGTVYLRAPLLFPGPASDWSSLFNHPREKIGQFFCLSSLGERRIATGEATYGALVEKP